MASTPQQGSRALGISEFNPPSTSTPAAASLLVEWTANPDEGKMQDPLVLTSKKLDMEELTLRYVKENIKHNQLDPGSRLPQAMLLKEVQEGMFSFGPTAESGLEPGLTPLPAGFESALEGFLSDLTPLPSEDELAEPDTDGLVEPSRAVLVDEHVGDDVVEEHTRRVRPRLDLAHDEEADADDEGGNKSSSAGLSPVSSTAASPVSSSPARPSSPASENDGEVTGQKRHRPHEVVREGHISNLNRAT
ncbi:hypothetical protein BDN72DRAFT_905239 [Pluteus cervinus]|uniref:Uncharacterized protein n=1 Tax=Pluteus cervinus TaxID=181527 RepID=A0ACD3A370_9AGAR|nr:hypothetical protein BDN72DRAFT_905239 [Pluteus cervinus]